ncbi:MAG TPA: sortase [Ilumatobacteraceae bacterium]|nr:sortase [Ilumatobacteraceae bacterium]HRB01711.1 sortase [Ilumatobacteraceae bacterium]
MAIGAQQLGPSAAEFDTTSPAFATHLGSLLEATRRRDGRSIRDLAAATGHQFGAGRLRRIERGSASLDESMIEAVCRLYGVDLGAILPSRVSLTIEDGVMVINGSRVSYEHDDPTSVLSGYLQLIRAVRDEKKAPAIPLRRDDIDRLATYLGLDAAEVLDRLALLMGATVAQRIAIGSLFAAGAIMVALVVASHVDAGAATLPGSSAVSAAVAVPSRPTIQEAMAPASSASLAPAVRVMAPVVAQPTAVANQSGCNTDVAGAVMSLTIPDISYECPVYTGGQAQIDAGFVTLVTAVGPNAVLATQPGAAGTLWLAAHRNSNGSAFADVPDLADGALVTVTAGGATATYRVVGRTYVEVRNDQVVDAKGNPTALATWESIIRPDLSGNLAPRLVLQTCEGANFRWMIYADLVT